VSASLTSAEYMQRFMALHPKLIDLKLERTLVLLEKLGNPHKNLPPVIHVAGTNGKGSTIAFMRAMLEAAGKKVHVYTSPHLVEFNERIRLAGSLVSEAQLLDAFQRCEAVNAGAPITVFEMTTAAAFLLFSEVPADVLLLEVGLGGRYDATNVVDTPLGVVITPVSIDHREYLGETIDKIAAEKAGIIKRGVPTIIAAQTHQARDVIEVEAARLGASLVIEGQDFSCFEEHGRMIYQDEHGLLDLPLPKLLGRHQYGNAATAIATLRTVFGNDFSSSAIETGLLKVEWPARMQRLSHGALAKLAPAGAELWLDGGHNAAGGQALADLLGEMEEKTSRPLILIVGMLVHKEISAFLKLFTGIAQEIYPVDKFNQPTSCPADELADIARNMGLNAAIAGNIHEIMRFLAARHWSTPPRILICGSLYLAGEILKNEKNEKK
jgi:dihydrofolate synthase / folylpolyglutamate synthase